MQTTALPISTVLKRISDKRYLIPQFQRPFRWNTGQVKLLVDSIARRYPIGSILVLARSHEINLRARSLDLVEDDDAENIGIIADDASTDVFYILDGQQRLTSLARTFLNADPKRVFYFDLLEMMEAFRVDDADRETSWIRVYYRRSEEPDRRKRNRLMRADLALNQQKCDVYVSEYIEDSPDLDDLDRSRRRSEAARIKGYFERIRAYAIPFVTIEPEVGLESICRVFETINSTGTRLTTFDLAVARFYPQPDLRALMEAAKDRNPVLGEFEIEGDRILQIIAIVRADQERRLPEPSRSELLRLPADLIEKEWDAAVEAMVGALKWAQDNGARPGTLPNFGIVVSLAAFMRMFPGEDRRVDIDWGTPLRRWYFSRLLRPGGRAAANWLIGRDYLDLARHKREGGPLTFENVVLSEAAIVEMPEQDNRFKALQCIIAAGIKRDLWTGKNLAGEDIEEHHIFPRAGSRGDIRKRKLYESIANRTLVLKSTNRSLSDERPEHYMSRLAQEARVAGVVDGLRERLREHLIPWSDRVGDPQFGALFSEQNVEQFIQERAKLVLQRVREVIGGSLMEAARTEGEKGEDEVED